MHSNKSGLTLTGMPRLAPAGDSFSFASPKKSNQKKGHPQFESPRFATGNLRCSIPAVVQTTRRSPQTSFARCSAPASANAYDPPTFLGRCRSSHQHRPATRSKALHASPARAGWLGAVVPDAGALDTPGIVRVLDEVPPVLFPIWLVSHRELRTLRRIRVVFEALAQGLAGGNA